MSYVCVCENKKTYILSVRAEGHSHHSFAKCTLHRHFLLLDDDDQCKVLFMCKMHTGCLGSTMAKVVQGGGRGVANYDASRFSTICTRRLEYLSSKARVLGSCCCCWVSVVVVVSLSVEGVGGCNVSEMR